MQLNAYLNFPGHTEEAFNFYKSVFGGEFATLQRFKDTPHGAEMSAEEQEKLMHVALPVGDNMLMGSDALESMGQKTTMGNNMSLSLHPKTKEEADRIFKGLSEGGQVTMPLADTFWNAYFGMLTDKFGIQWMINVDLKK